MYDKIEEIIKIEWEMFQKVDNIGGRASCQEDPETFYIMRKSQYDNWSPAMVDCYLEFARKCKADGRNLPAEKYARMMAYTNLHYYNKHLAHKLPPVPLAHYRIINNIKNIIAISFHMICTRILILLFICLKSFLIPLERIQSLTLFGNIMLFLEH